jgi:hypothetical protein
MKNKNLFYILLCMVSLLFTIGCEKAEIRKPGINEIADDQRISPRTISSCNDCPIGYCCCAMERGLGTSAVDLDLCGAYDPTFLCSMTPPSGCSTINTNGKDIILNSSHIRELFCVPAGNSFSITNNTGSAVTIRFSCDYDVTSPTYVSVSLTNGQTKYFKSSGTCFLEECM